MTPRMTPDEIALFTALLRSADAYLEFGCGGSTALAAKMVQAVTSVDSSAEWLLQVEAACKPAVARLIHVDIGKTREWGFPDDPRTRDRWPDYHGKVWDHPDAAGADLYLIDGRFRVACFAQTLLRCRPEARLVIHDYRSRPGYHVVERFARPIVEAGDLTAFQRRTDFNPAEAVTLLLKHAFDPA
jgi:hypothetical protein